MKQLSSIDIHFLTEELEDLKGSRVDKIYNQAKDEIYIQLYKSNIGKKLLRIIVGKAFFLVKEKSTSEEPSGFCMLLRKHLEGKFLDSITQLKPERIIEIYFCSKDDTKRLYLEFFGKGNVILCNENNIIIDALTHNKFKERSIFPKEKYIHPVMPCNIFNLGKNFGDLFKNSKKDKIVTSLAVELGLGGIYSEEVCILSGIDKSSEPKKITDSLIKKLAASIKKIIRHGTSPTLVYQNKEAIDVTPIGLKFYSDYEKNSFQNFSSALEHYYAKELKIIKDNPYAKKINELNRIIEEQRAAIKILENEEKELRKKGELIYENYQLINEVINELNKASKKYSWEEIKEKLKGHKVIKEVSSDCKVVVEL
ncbi:NFACT family protein [Candidatus Woesearchaeota archaeon]|nr:NFACT family protein [Candidatus Woesearchaeota archaeon]